MVKRAKSPEAAEDETYFVVYQPYPLNANWELPSDYIVFSRWIAGCIGTEPLHALHYKPKARGMVLLEVDKRYPHNERLLGEHRWSDFLKKPSNEEVDRVSQIFYSIYDTGRAAQKDGWKRIHVETSWFRDWSPNNPIVKNPYPITYWCPVPPEDRTNKSLCRHLPTKVKPPPPRAVPPVVGSATWVGTKTGSPQVIQDVPGATKETRTKKKKTPATKAPNNSAAAGQSISLVSPVVSRSAWDQPILPKRQNAAPIISPPPPATSAASSPISPLGPDPRIPASYPAPPGLMRSSTFASGPGTAPQSLDELFENNVTIAARDTTTVCEPNSDGSEDLDGDYYLAPAGGEVGPATMTTTTMTASVYQESAAEVEDLWSDVKNGGLVKAAPVRLCPVHGKVCKKGICSAWAKAEREWEKEKAKAMQKAAGDGEGSKKGGGRNGRRGNRREEKSGAGAWTRDRPKHMSVVDTASVRSSGSVGGPGRGVGRLQSRDEDGSLVARSVESAGGWGMGRERAYSTSSNVDSVAGTSESGLTDTSVWA